MTTPDPFRPNQLIPGTNYRYIRVLGEGGQGIVVLAADDFLQTEVVLKFVHASHALYLSTRIRDEARTLAKLKHPGIVRVIGGGMTAEDVPRAYFAMECLEGDTLFNVLVRQPNFPVHLCLEIVIDVLEALDYAHSAPHSLIHRDIKPGNIFMARIPPKLTRPVVLDFGLAQLFEDASKATGKRFVGTLEYAAPEQLLGRKLTPRADLYAVGVVLYELIAGRHPFADALRSQDRRAIAIAHIEEVPRRLSTLGFDLDPALDELVFCALEKDPARRPRSAHDFVTKLKAIHTRLEMLHPEPKSHDRTEEEPLEILWARMGISVAKSGPSSLTSARSTTRPSTHEDPRRALAPISPSREELVRAPTSPAPTEELPQTRHHRAAMARFRAADTDTMPPLKYASNAPVVQSSPGIVERHRPVLLAAAFGAILGVSALVALYEYQTKSAPRSASAPASDAARGGAIAVVLPPPPIATASSARVVVPTASPSVTVTASAVVASRVNHRDERLAHVAPAVTNESKEPSPPATATSAATVRKLPGSGLNDPTPAVSTPPAGFDLLKDP